MNINDIKEEITVPENIWEAIWEKQTQLAEKYKDIEGMGDLLETTETNIDTAKGQKWIKDFAWRVTEELTEADESVELFNNDSDWRNSDYRTHYLEEVTDALHFFVELCIITGHGPKFFENINALGESNSYEVIYQMGLMCNCLKNKPWKQTQMLTDKAKFGKYLKAAFEALVKLFYTEGLADIDIFKFYFKKNAVNQFRIRSKY